jgi:pilus assembly protein Flp/PilA
MRTYFDIVATWIQARFNTDERGAALVEYALLVALIAVVSIAILTTMGEGIKDKFSEVNSKLAS